VWGEAGRFLLGFGQYALAREFLERAAVDRPADNLDLAIAIFFNDGPSKALSALEKVTDIEKCGDCLLLKASILDAAGRREESDRALERGLRIPASRPQTTLQAALLLVRRDRKQEALDLLGKAPGSSPDLRLTRVIVLASMDQNSAAIKAVREIEAEWPEWDRAWLVDGLLLERTQPREAAAKFRTALALGSEDAAAECALHRVTADGVTAGGARDAKCSCRSGLYDLLFPGCGPG
jgi:tetratricopeptide (TPR) repeat protein